MDNVGKFVAAFLAAVTGILVTASAVIGIMVAEALTGLHLGAATVAALIGTGGGAVIWRWCTTSR